MGADEAVVCKIDVLKNGEMKTFNVNNVDVLLSKINNEFHATGAFCTHYGAPLEDGVLSGDRIVCPWHHACFNTKNGDLLEPPARDAIPSYEVKIDGENIIINLPEEVTHERIPEMREQDSSKDGRAFIVLGGGAAGNAGAQTLREDGFQGKIIMITKENRTPYDRPNLSKEYLQGEAEPDWMPLRSQDFYDDHNIELIFNKKVVQVNVKDKSIVFSDKQTLDYDKLLIATGGIARSLTVPGSDLKNIFTLRSFDDADKIIEASETASKAVVIGASFIGMETAYSLHHRKIPVTVIAPESVPFEKVFGREIGEMFQRLHEEVGVNFKLEHYIEKFEGDTHVEGVSLKNGECIEADLVIVGVGVKPATDFIEGIPLENDGSIKVDQNFRVGNDIYAAGDIATFPYWYLDSDIRIEHWRTAEQQGRIAAHNMAGNEVAFKSIPFFWTTQASINFRYVGYAREWDEIVINGDIENQNFIVFYVKNDQVHAAVGCNCDREMAAIEELMRLKKMPSPEKLKNESFNLMSLLRG